MGRFPWPWLAVAGLLAGCGDGTQSPDDDDDVTGDDDNAEDDDDDDSAAGDDDDTAASDDDTGDDDTAPAPLPEIAITCADVVDDVYVTPAGLPPWDDTVLGDVVRCTPDEVLSVAELLQRLDDAGVVGVTPFSGAAVYRIAYRTTRWEGEEGIGTARIYLPDTAHPTGPMPVVVATHGTIGLADLCAPSKYDDVSTYLTLPFAGNGFAVVAPDYAGLGTDGVQGYGDNADTAHSVLDAARALREAVTPDSLAPGVIVSGHSQGGGAALSAHAFGSVYGDGDVLGVIPFAPGWAYSTDNLWGVSHYPALVPFGGSTALVVSLQLYADAANFLDPAQATTYFHEDIAEDVGTYVETECVLGLTLHLPGLAYTLAGAVDEAFLGGVAACLDGEAGCVAPAEGYVERAVANIVPADPASGPILILQGMQDESSTPERTACIVDKLIDDGVTPQVCTFTDLEHMDVVENTVAMAVQWAEALATGEDLPACADSDLPACEQ